MKTLLLALLYIVTLHAQQAAPPPAKLAFLVPDLLSNALLSVDPTIRPLVDRAISPRFASINGGVAAALSNLPIPSPASGFSYSYDRQLGVYVPTPQSLGPILSERAETIGKNKFFFAVTFQRFQFDRLDDVDFRSFRVGIPLQIPIVNIPGLITADTTISLSLSQTTAHFTYGLTHKIDVSYALPVVTSTMQVRTEGTFIDLIRKQQLASLPRSAVAASSTGLGDGIVRVKATLFRRSGAGLALLNDFRIPTGDEFNYHGAGAFGVKPFLAASFTKGPISPHLNAGYQWNGRSFLGTAFAREKSRLPGQIFVSAGAEAAVSRRLTLSADVFDQVVVHGARTFLGIESAVDGTPYQSFYFPNRTRHEVNASLGFKARIASDLVLTGNLLFRLNHSGLRARAVPLVGLSYIF